MNESRFDGASPKALVAAVGEFMSAEVVPALSRGEGPDRAMAYRVKIAANLLRIALSEEATGPPPPDASVEDALRHKLAVLNPRFDLSEDID